MSDLTADVVQRERRFYNDSDASYRRWRRAIWRAIGAFNRDHELHDLYDANRKRVLLYGCGPANGAEEFINAGAASLTGIDISESEIATAQRQAHEHGCDGKVQFQVADGHETGFPDDSFDLVVGTGILHHLDVRRALAEIRRILAPGGRAVFQEPLAHNPLLRLGRWVTPAARTADEHPFTVRDWQQCGEAFPGFLHREVELISIPLMPLNFLLPQPWQAALARRVRVIDDRLLERYPRLRPLARMTFLILE